MRPQRETSVRASASDIVMRVVSCLKRKTNNGSRSSVLRIILDFRQVSSCRINV